APRVVVWLGLGAIFWCTACATPGAVPRGKSGGSPAALQEQALEHERTALLQQVQSLPPAQLRPQLRRDLGWAQLWAGDPAAPAQLERAQHDASDVRALLGLGL